MGMPVSLALRGRHADDDRGGRAWDRVRRRCCARSTGSSAPTARTPCVSRLGRGEVGVGDCPPEVAEVLALGEQARRESGGAFDVRRPDRTATACSTRAASSRAGRCSGRPRCLRRAADTDVCLSAGGDMVCRDAATPRRRRGGSASRTRATRSGWSPSSRCARGAVATSGAAHRGEHIVDARTGAPPGAVASVTVVADDLTWADIDATAAYAQGADALTWLRGRPGRRGLVVWADGRSDVFDATS